MEPSFSVLTNGSRWGLRFRNSFMIMSWRLTIGTPSHTQNMFRISITLSPKFLQQKPQFRECRERKTRRQKKEKERREEKREGREQEGEGMQKSVERRQNREEKIKQRG